jgi:hypothetical protein
MMNPNPNCPKSDCLFQEVGPSMTTSMYYAPIYDKHGNNVNPDGNITSGTIKCITCNQEWMYSSRLGKTKFTEMHKIQM